MMGCVYDHGICGLQITFCLQGDCRETGKLHSHNPAVVLYGCVALQIVNVGQHLFKDRGR